MPERLADLGLGTLCEDEEAFMGLVTHVVQEGVPIAGYYDLPYMDLHLGSAQMIVRTERTEGEDGKRVLRPSGFDTHCAGYCVWKVRILDTLKAEDDDPLLKKLLVERPNGQSMATVYVVNADVLPSYRRGEVIDLQTIAFPRYLRYFKDQDEYEASVEPGEDGKKVFASDGLVLPVGLLGKEKDIGKEDCCYIHGIVKRIFPGMVRSGEEECHPYVDCVVETRFGDIEILHRLEGIPQEQRQAMRPGSIVDCVALLSGDAAIPPYDKGIVRSFDNDLKLVAYSFSEGDPERMRPVLAKDFVYHSESSGKHFETADEFIEFSKKVLREGKPCHAKLATLIQPMEEDGPKEGAPRYPVGTRCIALAYEGEKGWDCLVFIDVDDRGDITRIFLSRDRAYRFEVDREPQPKEDDPDVSEPSLAYRSTMIIRAYSLGILRKEIALEDIERFISVDHDELRAQIVPIAKKKADADSFAEAYLAGVAESGASGYDPEEIGKRGRQLYHDLAFHSFRGGWEPDVWLEALMFAKALGTFYPGQTDGE